MPKKRISGNWSVTKADLERWKKEVVSETQSAIRAVVKEELRGSARAEIREVVREEFRGPVFREEIRAVVREELKGPVFREEVRAIVKEELGAAVREMKRWMKVYAENISAEVRGGFKDQASLLKAKDRELEARIVVLEQRAGIAQG